MAYIKFLVHSPSRGSPQRERRVSGQKKLKSGYLMLCVLVLFLVVKLLYLVDFSIYLGLFSTFYENLTRCMGDPGRKILKWITHENRHLKLSKTINFRLADFLKIMFF